MKKVLLPLLGLMMSLSGFAQDAQAEQLLKDVAAKFKSYDNISFTYKGNMRNDQMGISRDLQGEVAMSGEKYNVTYLGTQLIYDGNKQYMINPEDEQVTITKVTEENTDAILPSNILTFYEKGYRKKMDIVQNKMGRQVQYVRLDPIKSDSDYSKVLIGIDSNTKHIYNVILTEKSGSVMTFTLKKLKVNEPLPKNTFVFTPEQYQDYDIEELD